MPLCDPGVRCGEGALPAWRPRCRRRQRQHLDQQQPHPTCRSSSSCCRRAAFSASAASSRSTSACGQSVCVCVGLYVGVDEGEGVVLGCAVGWGGVGGPRHGRAVGTSQASRQARAHWINCAGIAGKPSEPPGRAGAWDRKISTPRVMRRVCPSAGSHLGGAQLRGQVLHVLLHRLQHLLSGHPCLLQGRQRRGQQRADLPRHRVGGHTPKHGDTVQQTVVLNGVANVPAPGARWPGRPPAPFRRAAPRPQPQPGHPRHPPAPPAAQTAVPAAWPAGRAHPAGRPAGMRRHTRGCTMAQTGKQRRLRVFFTRKVGAVAAFCSI